MRFALEPCDESWLVTAPYRFHNEAVLDATAEEVFAIWADVEQWPKWFPDFVSARWLTEPGYGAQREIRLTFLAGTEKFIAYDPGRRFCFYMEEFSLPLVSHMMEDYRLEPLEVGCRFTWDVYYRPKTIVRPLHPILRPIFAKMFRDGTSALQEYVAARP